MASYIFTLKGMALISTELSEGPYGKRMFTSGQNNGQFFSILYNIYQINNCLDTLEAILPDRLDTFDFHHINFVIK